MTPDSNELLAVVATWMMQHSIPTGHGDTLDDLLNQIAGSKAAPPSDDVRSALADELEDVIRNSVTTNVHAGIILKAVRALRSAPVSAPVLAIECRRAADNLSPSGEYWVSKLLLRASIALSAPAVGVTREAMHRELNISSDYDHRSWKDLERVFDKLLGSPAPDATVSANCQREGCGEVIGDKPDPRWDQGQCGTCGKWFHKSSPQDVGREATVSAVTLEQISEKAREWALRYPPHSDGRNTFWLFSEWVDSLSRVASGARP
jgi:hypothetical protein